MKYLLATLAVVACLGCGNEHDYKDCYEDSRGHEVCCNTDCSYSGRECHTSCD